MIERIDKEYVESSFQSRALSDVVPFVRSRGRQPGKFWKPKYFSFIAAQII